MTLRTQVTAVVTLPDITPTTSDAIRKLVEVHMVPRLQDDAVHDAG